VCAKRSWTGACAGVYKSVWMLYGFPMTATTTTYEAAVDFEHELAQDIADDQDYRRSGDAHAVDMIARLYELELVR
jgi:hypothetical protein